MWRPYTKTRVLIALAGCLSAVCFPWWVTAAIILMLACLWPAWEAMFLGLLMDFLWLPPHTFPLFTAGALAVVWLLEPIRREFLAR